MNLETYKLYKLKYFNYYLSRYKISVEDLEEIFLDSLMIFNEKYDKERSSENTFFSIVIRSNIIIRIKKRKVETISFDDDNNFTLETYVNDSEYDYDMDEKYERLRNEIENMAGRDGLICRWYFIHRMKSREIAEIMEMKDTSIRTIIHTQKAKLKKKLLK